MVGVILAALRPHPRFAAAALLVLALCIEPVAGQFCPRHHCASWCEPHNLDPACFPGTYHSSGGPGSCWYQVNTCNVYLPQARDPVGQPFIDSSLIGQPCTESRKEGFRGHCQASYAWMQFKSTQCYSCPAGRYQDQRGGMACAHCQAGTWGAGGSASSTCSGPCAAGRWGGAGETSSQCSNACPAGKFGNVGLAPELASRVIDTYNENQNIALNRQTSQGPGTAAGGVPSRAVDGNANGNWGANTCTHTNNGDPWWEVDLGNTYDVRKVTVHHRTDCCMERSQGALVTVDGTHLGHIFTCNAGSKLTRGATGRHLRISNAGNVPLTLCEVLVYGSVHNPSVGGTSEATACEPCPAGKSSDQVASTACVPCVPGKFSTQGATICQPCPAGKYGETSGLPSSACSGTCSIGRYSTDGALACGYCLAGRYSYYPGAPSCTYCNAGKYGATSGLTTSGCSGACAPGRYSTQGAASCTACNAGKYGADSGLTASVCSGTCEPGQYSTQGATSCTDCEAGKYGATSGLTTSDCSGACEPGQYSTQDAPSCTDCEAGKYGADSGLTTSDCSGTCAPGRYSTQNALSCTDCEAGKYGVDSGLTTSDCSGACAPGRYSGPGLAYCIACSEGKYSTTAAQTNSDGCVDCASGSYAQPAASSCEICRMGTTDGDSQPSTPCEACLPGMFTAAGHYGNCTHCPHGYHDADQDPATPCDTDADTCVGTSSCDAVPMVSNSLTNRQACEAEEGCVFHASPLCSAGTHVPTSGMTDCPDCLPGRADEDSDPTTDCGECPQGRFSPSRATSCSPCESGFVDHDRNPATPCVICEAGKYRSADISCDDCTAGRFSRPGASSCSRCESGFVDHDSDPATPCIICEAGRFKSEEWQCDDCPAGRYAQTSGAVYCIDCDAGQHVSTVGSDDFSDCVDCAPGHYADFTGASDCIACAPGQYANTTARSIACIQCSAGRWAGVPGATECIDCVAGTHVLTVGSDNISDCIDCAPGQYVDITGASSCIECAAGKFMSIAGSDDIGDCIDCAPGRYANTTARSTACNNCSAGTWVGVPSATECSECVAGKSLNVTGSSSDCLDCQEGQYTDVPGRDFCTSCVPGTFSIAVGAASATSCQPCGLQSYDDDKDPTTACVVCGLPQVVIDRVACGVCSAGTEPTVDHDGCSRCVGSTYSPCGGTCALCQFPNIANSNKTSCEEVAGGVLTNVADVIDVLSSGTNLLPQVSLQMRHPGSEVLGMVSMYLQADLADALRVNYSEVLVSALTEAVGGRRRSQSTGNLLVHITISSPNAGEILLELEQQLGDENSGLQQGGSTSLFVSNGKVEYTFVCAVGLIRAPGDANCQPCAANSIPDETTNFETCLECPAGRAPNVQLDQCVCAAGFYNASQGTVYCYGTTQPWKEVATPADVCVSCVDLPCIDCQLDDTQVVPGYAFSVGLALRAQAATSGRVTCVAGDLVDYANVFKALGSDQRGVFACDMPDVCTGNPVCPCVQGYGGPLCSLCAEGWSRSGFSGPCSVCDSYMSGVWVFFATLLAIACVTAVLYISSGFHGGGLVHKIVPYFKIGITLVQILTQLQFCMEIRWPEAFTVLLRLLKLVSLDWLNFIDIGCLTPYRYYEKFAFAVLTMPIMVTCVAGIYHFGRNAENIADRCIRMALTAIFLTFPFVSQTTFQGFSCLQLDQNERWLDIDLQIDCDSDGHAVFYYFGVIGVLLYPVGIPVATMWVLVKNRASIKMDGPMRTRYEFLVTDYKRKCEGCRLMYPSRVFIATAQLTCLSDTTNRDGAAQTTFGIRLKWPARW